MTARPILSVKLSHQGRDFIERKMESGEYSSEEDVLNESLALLEDQEKALEDWMQKVGAPIYDRMQDDPSLAISSQQLEQHLEEKRRKQHAHVA